MVKLNISTAKGHLQSQVRIILNYMKYIIIIINYLFRLGRAIAEAVSRWLPTAAARFWQVGFVVDRERLGRFSPITSVSPTKIFHSTNFFILTFIRGS
jgi:hypothetical protein